MIIVDGPQGSGKTTLTTHLRESVFTEGVLYRKFDAHSKMTETQLSVDEFEPRPKLYERGLLSEHIYGHLWSADITYRVENGDVLLDWHPVRLSDLEVMTEKMGHMFILHARYPETLVDRIKRREAETGRSLTERELRVVEYSNALFKGYGEMLSMIAPGKVTMLECESHDSGVKGMVTDLVRKVIK